MTHRRAIRLVFACWIVAAAALLLPSGDGPSTSPQPPAGSVEGSGAHAGHSVEGIDPLTTVALAVNVVVLLGIAVRLARPPADDDDRR